MYGHVKSMALAFPVLATVAALLSAQAPTVVPPAPVSFAKDVDPILERSCRSCHGDAAQLGKLDLSTRESALRGGARGSDLVPGNAEASRLYRRIAGLEQPPMPAQGEPLTVQRTMFLPKVPTEAWVQSKSPRPTPSPFLPLARSYCIQSSPYLERTSRCQLATALANAAPLPASSLSRLNGRQTALPDEEIRSSLQLLY